jgi:transcriptional regulator with XRE-family HTH domain
MKRSKHILGIDDPALTAAMDETGNRADSSKSAAREDSMAKGNCVFARVIRERRRQLDLTQREVARRIRTSTPYVGHLESGKRHPSEKILTRLADVLGIEPRELFFLANPNTKVLLDQEEHTPVQASSAWEDFRSDESIHRLHRISAREMYMLSQVALMGQVRTSRDFIYILNTVRQSLAS